jgi:hypothetical protein
MNLYARNHALMYRPLIGGIGITAQGVGEVGTLGMIAYDATGAWIVSNYHVLCRRDLSAFSDGEAVYQCFMQPGDTPIARLVTGRASTALDCAAARVEAGIDVKNWVLELGAITGVEENPQKDRPVIKSGLATGVTEGCIAEVNGDRVRIQTWGPFPARYDLSNIGDSGSVWVDAETRRAVALHSRTQDGETEAAYGFKISSVLAALQLQLNP